MPTQAVPEYAVPELPPGGMVGFGTVKVPVTPVIVPYARL
jgi:hypothetical protein